MATDWIEKFTLFGGQPSQRLGQRFDTSGRFLPEAGNTIVAKVISGSQTEAALIDLRAELQRLPYADHFAFTDVASYHMTVFEGVVETQRETSLWPVGIDPMTDLEVATKEMVGRLQDFAAPPPFKMQITGITPFGLNLAGATPQDEVFARAWRDVLSERLGVRTSQHGRYEFHTTLAYAVHWPPASAVPIYQRALDELYAWFRGRVPVMDLARPAFCRFSDMNAFPPIIPL